MRNGQPFEIPQPYTKESLCHALNELKIALDSDDKSLQQRTTTVETITKILSRLEIEPVADVKPSLIEAIKRSIMTTIPDEGQEFPKVLTRDLTTLLLLISKETNSPKMGQDSTFSLRFSFQQPECPRIKPCEPPEDLSPMPILVLS